MAKKLNVINNSHDASLYEELRQMPFFKGFEDELLWILVPMVATAEVPAGTEVLVQGQANSMLYFLVSGRLEVVVDGSKLTELALPGELVGEMSVFNEIPCTATIKAKDDCSLYVIDSTEFWKMQPNDRDRLFHSLFRTYAATLSERLQATNQKAKRIEAVNEELKEAQKELQELNQNLEKMIEERTQALRQKTIDILISTQQLEAQNAELTASHKKLEEFYSARQLTFSKLEALYKDHLLPMKFSLEDLQNRITGKDKQGVQKAIGEVNEVMDLLEPITNLYNTEQAMKSKKVLLADGDKKQQLIAKMALGGTGVELDIVSSTEDAFLKIDEKNFDVVFVESGMLDFMDKLREADPRAKIVFMSSEAIPDYLPKLRERNFLPNIVSRDEGDRVFTIKNIMTTVSKLTSQDIFGMEKYLTWGVDVVAHEVACSSQRQELIEQMSEHFEKLGMRASNRERCRTVSEELLMNAIYDAPTDSTGKALYNHLDRTTAVNLKAEERSTYRYATDGMLMAVSVEDPFGSLNPETVLNYLETCYFGRAGELNREKGGAGRGLHQIVENSDLVVFNIKEGIKTEVIAFFNVDIRESKDKNPSFHLFYEQNLKKKD